MTDVAGVVVWSASYTPFGTATVNEDPDGDGRLVKNNFRFPGQYYDAETGLNYNYFRTYDPLVGRYTQSDPIGLRGGLNVFGYVLNDPVSGFDIKGLRVDWNGMKLSNPKVIVELKKLNGLIVQSGIPNECFTLKVTGGDRYIGADGRHYSSSNHSLVPNSDEKSPHLESRGARAIDLKLINLDRPIFDNAYSQTNFAGGDFRGNYADGHIHIALPNNRRWYANPF